MLSGTPPHGPSRSDDYPVNMYLDFFQFEAWLHAGVPRVGCTACGKTSQIAVQWAREGSGFTLLFEALALTMCQGLPVRQAARMLRVRDKQLWRVHVHGVVVRARPAVRRRPRQHEECVVSR